MNYYNESVKASLLKLKTSTNGLTTAQVNANQRKHGKNAIKLETKSFWQKLIEPFADVFMVILLIAAGISWHQGHIFDTLVIGIVVIINAGIFYLQSHSTEKILRSLNKQASQPVVVKRNGGLIKIDSEELTVGDILYLSEGDKVPADGRIIEAERARVDESMLTGESLPISKNNLKIAGHKKVYEQKNIIFSGSFVVTGNITAVITAIGMNTEFGKIASFSKPTTTISPIQTKINKLVTQIIVVVAIVMIGILAFFIYTGTSLEESLTFVLATTVSVIPEGLPVAITIILALSMKRMASEKALVRNLRSIESIGLVNVIATDKTGTLTKNQLSIVNTWSLKKFSKPFLTAVWGSMVVSETNHFPDPLDKAIYEFSRKNKLADDTLKLVRTMPFDQALTLSGAIYQSDKTTEIFIKGSPEKIMAMSNLRPDQIATINQALSDMILNGSRIIAIAKCSSKTPIHDLEQVEELEFLGLIELADPLRPEAKSAVRQAQQAGIKVVMITGDHAKTAYNIGRQLGITTRESDVLDMSQIYDYDAIDFEEKVLSCSVFARVTPEAKFKLLQALKKSNITAMTGDGVNDTPALVESNTGIAMGSGSSIAKDASDIIILDDNFKTIVTAVKEGRTTVHNIRRILFYLFSTNLGELLTFMTALLLRMPLPLAAVQILWVNLMTDTTFVIPLGLQPAQDNIMKAKPKSPDAPLLNRSYLLRIALVSIAMTVLTISIYRLFEPQGVAYARTMAFTALVVSQWANAYNATSFSLSVFDPAKKRNRLMNNILLISIIAHLVVIFTPINTILQLTAVSLIDLGLVAIISTATIVVLVEVHKLINRFLYFQPFYK